VVTTPNPDLATVRDILRPVPFFRELTQPEMDLLVALGHVVAYPRNMVVFREGDKGEALYVVIGGAVRIVSHAPEASDGTMAFVESGGCFGEMALVDDFPRSATAIAQDDSTVLFLGRDALLDLFREEPVVGRKILAAFCRSLSLRLRHANDRIVALSSLQRGA
jgi:CRP/FNR family transcriptional regulator/CRP/FNR family cyclic AMP-dependent transcriptional regulator